MRLNSGWLLAWLSLNSLLIVACQPSKSQLKENEGFNLPDHFPEWPSEHPVATAEQIELGRWLFYDRRLSRDGTRSCGICHEQAKAFSDGLSLALGIENTMLPLNSPSLFNIAWRTELTWNRRFKTVEEQMHGPLFSQDPLEMGMTEELLIERISEYSRYEEFFQAAFPDEDNPITTENTIYAIASFTRSIISADSKYDRWLLGEEELSDSEEQGRQLFFSERLKCAACHGGVFFDEPDFAQTGIDGRHGYFNTGLYNVDGQGSYPASAQGLIEKSGIEEDMGKFKIPTLRNLESTYPWMHDGSEISLQHIISNYADGGRVIESSVNVGDGRENPYKSILVSGFDISETEIEQLISFLASLNDDLLLTRSNLVSPFCIEQRGEIINEPCEPPFELD